MPYFSRLTDIVTCSLTALLKDSDDPQGTLRDVIREMEEGLGGAQRSVQSAQQSRQRLVAELDESREQSEHFDQQAIQLLQANDENGARMALYRKKEASDLMAGLEQQVSVANSTYEALMTTYRALEARLAEARRKLNDLGGSESADSQYGSLSETAQNMRHSEVELELAAMKERLNQS
ncbi:PspA/IM30 family protein [Rubinisphaera italica]|uniref:Phage shock protein A n=1 Tax=Rubinisphaera italica TaxID=2527969 RepID=A0A5C5XIM2_9PLAN|nr:PspA/IM30 family protein [Rubinisphaera italica]TWT63007.1 Phage shock protein A [Rubinisphaera italica]